LGIRVRPFETKPTFRWTPLPNRRNYSRMELFFKYELLSIHNMPSVVRLLVAPLTTNQTPVVAFLEETHGGPIRFRMSPGRLLSGSPRTWLALRPTTPPEIIFLRTLFPRVSVPLTFFRGAESPCKSSPDRLLCCAARSFNRIYRTPRHQQPSGSWIWACLKE